MLKKATIVILLCLAFPTLCFGQGATSNWYFGQGAGISFNSDGTIQVVQDGQLNTAEGCATISDTSGNLLFYTDGIVVYNRNHQVMDNGTDLYGDPSSTQSAIIVPQPDNPEVFYIFTVDTALSQNEQDRGLNYSIVDLRQNGGRGRVMEKNVPLLAHSSEKLAAVVKDCIDQSIWLLTLASSSGEKDDFDTYHAFEINGDGVAETSVKSTFENLAIREPRGYLKISSDGTQLASANMLEGLFVYDFDLATGIVSNQQRLSISGSNKASYGVEFSPSGQYLYVHASKDAKEENGHSSTLLQYDLQDTNISSSQVVLDDRSIFRGALQLGENGKIYRTIAKSFSEGTPFLGVINRPNEKGTAARYKHDAVGLGSKIAMQGLPPFVQSFLNKTDLLSDADGNQISVRTLCHGEDLVLEAEAIPGALYSWKKDGEPFDNPNNSFEIRGASDADSGRYQLQITLSDPLECPLIGEALIEVSPLPETDDLILTQCDIEDNNGPSDGYAVFNLNQLSKSEDETFVFYESQQDQTDDYRISNPEKYSNTRPFEQTIYYSSINEAGCKGFGEVLLQVSSTPLNESGLSPVLVCADAGDNPLPQGTIDLLTLANEGYAGFEVSFYSNLDDLAVEENQLEDFYRSGDTTIYARLEDGNQCLGVERLRLIVQPAPELEFVDTYEVCTDGEPLVLTAPPGYDAYAWYVREAGQTEKIGDGNSISLSEGGAYRLEVGRRYELEGQETICHAARDFTVIPSNKAVFQDIQVTENASQNTIQAITAGDGDYEYSLNGLEYQDSSTFDNVEAGFYTVFVRDKNGCGIAEEEVSVMGFPKFFTPNGDGFNDQWQLIGVGPDEATMRISIFDRLGTLMAELQSNGPGWDGTFRGKRLPASDYWFKVDFEDGTAYKGHFALKR